MPSEIAARAEFDTIRYAQCWEDADILTEALRPSAGHVLVSIMSAGDNTLALLTGNPARIIAVDLSPAQRACAWLRVAAYRTLSHGEWLELHGSRASQQRLDLYRRCRSALPDDGRRFWDARKPEILHGIGHAGKFERYFETFRTRILPLIHPRDRVMAILQARTPAERDRFYREHWANRRWNGLFRLFFSRRMMGLLGRDPEFFRYVDGSVSDRILERTRYAMTVLAPEKNPYMQWILTGQHGDALTMALRAEHFSRICDRLDRVEWRVEALEDVLDRLPEDSVDGFNLSDIFEYMSPANYERLLRAIVRVARPGARLAYWNMLVPRSRPESMAHLLKPMPGLSEHLFKQDKAWFYSRFIVEEVIKG